MPAKLACQRPKKSSFFSPVPPPLSHPLVKMQKIHHPAMRHPSQSEQPLAAPAETHTQHKIHTMRSVMGQN